MKLSTYNSQVNLNTLSGQVRAPRDPNSFGANTDGLAALGKALGQEQAVMMQMQEDKDAAEASTVNLEISKLRQDVLYGEKGLMNLQQDGAAGVSDAYTKKMNEGIANIMANHNFTTRKGQLVGKSLADKMVAEGYGVVSKHEYEQGEKYKDTTLTNNIASEIDFASNNINSDEIVYGGLNKVQALAINRVKGQGKEAEIAAARAASGDYGWALINSALAVENYDRTDALLQKFGQYLTPQQRSSVTKVNYANKKNNARASKFTALYDKYGPDGYEAALGELREGFKFGKTNTIEVAKGYKGMKYSLGGDGVSATDCGKLTQDVSTKDGGKVYTSRAIDMQYLQEEEDGNLFTDHSQLRDGDIVFWHVPGSQWKTTDNKNPSNDEAYKGVTHGGYYDASTGKVIQAGESGGVDYIDVSTYEVVGMAHRGGTELSPAQRQEEEDKLTEFYGGKLKIKNMAEQQFIASGSDAMLQMYDAGERDPNVFIKKAEQLAGPDYSKRSALLTVANNLITLSKKPARTQNDINTMLRLNRDIEMVDVNDIAAVRADLYKNADMLTEATIIAFDDKLNKKANGQGDSAGDAADKVWQAGLGNSENDRAIKAEILGILQAERVFGDKRKERANEILASKKAYGRDIATYSDSNRRERVSIKLSWGESGEMITNLLETGYKRGWTDVDGTPRKWGEDWHELNVLSTKIASEMQSDPGGIAEKTLDRMVAFRIPINPETWARAYAQVKGGQ